MIKLTGGSYSPAGFPPVAAAQHEVEDRAVRFDGLSTSPPPVAGTRVQVLYRPGRPEEARINSLVQRWLPGVVFLPVGIVILTAVAARQKRSRRRQVMARRRPPLAAGTRLASSERG